MIVAAVEERVPFLDLIAGNAAVEERMIGVLQAALATAGFVGGPMVEEFERAFSFYCGTRYCIGVSSGTDALRFALLAAGLGPGDTVITPCNTFIATTEAITQAGGQPAFVDVDEGTANLDPGKLQDFVDTECSVDAEGTLRTRMQGLRVKAVVPVHLYGQPADMDPIREIAARYRLEVIEDACQAHGAKYFSQQAGQWQQVGNLGRAAAFSFYPGKNLGACGEAGAVTTNDGLLAERVRMLRDHGQLRKYYHRTEGYNGRLDSIQAGFLRVKLEYLDEWNRQRRALAKWYDEQFGGTEGRVRPIMEAANSHSVYHLYVVRVAARDRLREYLVSQQIETGIHYPVPLHLQEAYRRLGFTLKDFPVAERLANSILSLPMFPQLQLPQQQRVMEAVTAGLRLI